MSTKELSKVGLAQKVEQVIVGGDLSRLSPEERVSYYNAVCQSVGLNPLTRPFDYIVLNSKLTLYARKDATDQLRSLNNVSIKNVERSLIDDMYEVLTHAENNNGRSDVDIGVVSLKGLEGEKRANAMMKAVTKSKRRVTLSICGLGFLDETEIETIPDAKLVSIDDNGEIVDEPIAQSKPAPAPAPVNGKRPYKPDVLRQKISISINKYANQTAPEHFRNMIAANLNQLFQGNEDSRHAVLSYLIGKNSTKEIDDAEAIALTKWLNTTQDSGGEWHVDPISMKEAQSCLTEALKAEGQQELLG